MAIQVFLALGFLAAFTALLFRLPQGAADAPIKKERIFGLTPKSALLLLLAVALVLRVFLGLFVTGFEVDINCFKAWGSYTHSVGFNNMYYSDFFIDYPPGYLYVLWALEGVRLFFGIDQNSAGATLLIKLAPILSDLACTALLWVLAKRRLSAKTALFLAGAYAFCPAVLVNSAVWGQADSFCALLLLAMLLLLLNGKTPLAAVLYGVAVLAKPQMLIFAPVPIFFVLRRRDWKNLILGPILAVAVMLLLAAPFVQNWGFTRIIALYTGTMDYYAYYTINAYNFWAMLGLNWGSLPAENTILLQFGVPLATALCGWLMLGAKREKQSGALCMAPVILMYTVYIFCIKMHERYLFPVLLCLLLTYIFTRDKRFLISFSGTALFHFLNVAYVLHLNNSFIEPTAPQIVLLSFAQTAMYGYTLYAAWRVFLSKKAPKPLEFKPRPAPERLQKAGKKVEESEQKGLLDTARARRFTALDVFLVSAVTVGYAIVAFWGLGDNYTANTSWTPQLGESVVFTTEDAYSTLYFLPGIAPADNGIGQRVSTAMTVEVSNDGETWTTATEDTTGSVYAWKSVALNATGRYLRITAAAEDLAVNEIALKKDDGTGFAALHILSGSGAALIDEQAAVPEYPSYMNSTYFDEIYHARTAYEHILGLEPYENTHPTLGKLIISVGIRIFGMNPFGWRFMGTLFGVLMLPILYHLIKRLFGSSLLAAAGTVLFAFDFMHYVQTRIATIDTYAVFFILLMYDAMLVFLQTDLLHAKPVKKLLPLFLSGLFMGLGAASKWTVAYAAVGLAVLFFGKLIYTYKSLEKAEAAAFVKSAVHICLWCCLFFIAVPFAVYFAAFLPLTTLAHNSYDVFGRFLAYQEHMFRYHSTLDATHTFQSPWYQWPFDVRNVWYYGNYSADGEGHMRTISVLGSPLLWWACVPATVYALVRCVKRRSMIALFVAVGFLSSYIPWVLVPRCTFIYHYFTAVPFILIALLFAFERLSGTPSMRRTLFTANIGGRAITLTTARAVMLGFVAVHLILFAAFHPVLTGTLTTQDYANSLEWLPTWFFA